MLLVKTMLGPSKINGIGLFANQFIPKGTLTWKFKPSFYIEITKDNLLKLPQHAKNQFLHYCYLDKKTNKYVLCFDDARFMNHSEIPTIEDGESFVYDGDIAIKDIYEGEELTYNYRKEDGDYARKFGIIDLLNDFEKQNLPLKNQKI